jgi:hypothetical protein
MIKPALSKAELRAQLEAAVADYRGAVTYCPPGALPEPEPDELDLDDDEDEFEPPEFVPAGTQT